MWIPTHRSFMYTSIVFRYIGLIVLTGSRFTCCGGFVAIVIKYSIVCIIDLFGAERKCKCNGENAVTEEIDRKYKAFG